MTTLVRVGAAVGLALGAWFTLGALASTDAASASMRLGILPGATVLLGLLGAAAIAVLVFGSQAHRLLPFLFLFVLALPWLPLPLPTACLTWVGPMAMLVWLAAAGAFVAGLSLRVPRRVSDLFGAPRRSVVVAAALAFLIYAAAAHRLHESGLVPGGDEPHYLVITQSLLLDGDLRIENNHQRSDYRSYIGIPLKPDFLKRGTDGQIYSVHAPGLPALLVPAFAVAGYPGAVWFLAMFAALGTALAWHASWKVTGSAAAAWFGWASVALSTSLLFHAFAIYPEIVAAVVFLVVVWALTSKPRPLGWFGMGAALALLPWLHTRLALMAAVLGAIAVERLMRRADRVRCLLAFSSVPLVSAVAWFGFFRVIYGTFDPAAPYGGAAPTGLVYVGRGLVGLLFDHQFGLVANAPVYVLAAVGLVIMLATRQGARAPWASYRPLAVHILLVSVPYACVAAAYPMWWAGASAPARFLVPILLPLAIPVAVVWARAERRVTRACAFGLLAASVTVTLTLLVVHGGWLAFNVRDGYSRLWDWASPLTDVSLGLPSLFRHSTGEALFRAGAWMILFGAAWLALRTFDHRGTRHYGTLWLAILVAGWLVASMALSVGWAREGAPLTRPTASASGLLRAYDSRLHAWAVQYDGSPTRRVGVTSLAADQVLGRLVLDWEPRRARQAGELVWLGPLPAGDYRVRFEVARPTQSAVVLTIGRTDTWLERWDLAGTPAGSHERSFNLPVPIAGLFMRTEPPGDAAVTTASVQPVSLLGAEGDDLEPARQALRVGDHVAFLLNDGAYFEPGGFWLRSGRAARVAFASRRPQAHVPAAIRNAPVANTLHVRVGGWRQSFELTPGAERSLGIPARPNAAATVVEFLAEKGFQPALVDAASEDRRWLGCWVELR